MAKVKCPSCDIEATWSHQFFTHFIGLHVKGNDQLNEIIKRIEEQSEDDFNHHKKESANNDVLVRFDDEKKICLIERIENFEPEESNEKLIIVDCDDDNKGLPEEIYDLKNYIGKTCREERQYALYLANLLSNNDECVKKIIGIEKCKVDEVFYEATLMRDFWWRDKENFNSALWDYVKTKTENKVQCNKNMNTIKNHPNYWPNEYQHPSSTLARWMMNAKPDIAILYVDNGKYKLSFIECKYTSGEDTYKYEDYKKLQTEVQKDILEFLCSKLKIKYKGQVEEIINGEVFLVQFKGEHNGDKATPQGFVEVDIKDLVN